MGDEGAVKGRGEKFRDGEKKSGDSRKQEAFTERTSRRPTRIMIFFFLTRLGVKCSIKSKFNQLSDVSGRRVRRGE